MCRCYSALSRLVRRIEEYIFLSNSSCHHGLWRSGCHEKYEMTASACVLVLKLEQTSTMDYMGPSHGGTLSIAIVVSSCQKGDEDCGFGWLQKGRKKIVVSDEPSASTLGQVVATKLLSAV